jgi:Uma2 family endonuclease
MSAIQEREEHRAAGSTVGRRMTAEELWAMPETPGTRYELVEGELRELPGAGMLHNFLVGLLYRLLDEYARGRKLGVAFSDGLGYLLSREPDKVRIPDVSFIARGRLPEGGLPPGFCPFPPDLAVEIVSPNDGAEELHRKVREYLDAGVALVWVIWPRERAVTVYTSEGVQDLGPDSTLPGGDALPGFEVPVARLFEREY